MTTPINKKVTPETFQRYFSKDGFSEGDVSSINRAVHNLVSPGGVTEELLRLLPLGEDSKYESICKNDLDLLEDVRDIVAHYMSNNPFLSEEQKIGLNGRLSRIEQRIDAVRPLVSPSETSRSNGVPSAPASANAVVSATQQREAQEEAKPAVTLQTRQPTASHLTDEQTDGQKAVLRDQLSCVNESIGVLEENFGPEQGWVYLRSNNLITDEEVNKKIHEYKRLVDEKGRLEQALGIS
ncbi:MAG TPA: hypothetical protein VGE55_04450 [Limnobacter sp.]|uniref:hypothetical protein n=1 Tax=Limnobacter sp. TaxID=2003368 RepID=UPI002ED9081A